MAGIGTPTLGNLTATVTAGDIEIGAVEIKNSTDDIRAVVDATGLNVNVKNAAGASAVNIQDGGNSITVDGTLTVNTHAVTVASGGIASGAVASGAIASGAVASGAVASGAFASGSIASGAIVDGGDVALGTTTVARSTATDTTSVAVIPLLKEISYMEQNPASQAVTNSTASSLKVENVGTKTNNAAVPGATNVGTLQGIANAAAPTWTETYLVAESMDLSGNQRTTLGTLLYGENQVTNRLNVEPIYSFLNIVAAAPTTTAVKAGAGTLHSIVINKTAATGVITIYDNTSATGTLIGTITMPAAVLASQIVLTYDVSFTTGLTIVTATAAQDITVTYR